MTKREKEIIDLIKENPLITQEEIADKLNCARTSIAVHISNLMKKGIILGKKYIINEDPYILTMGETTVNMVVLEKILLKIFQNLELALTL